VFVINWKTSTAQEGRETNLKGRVNLSAALLVDKWVNEIVLLLILAFSGLAGLSVSWLAHLGAGVSKKLMYTIHCIRRALFVTGSGASPRIHVSSGIQQLKPSGFGPRATEVR
jgi:hypothetical protein